MSPYGHHVHAFREDKIGESFAEALCGHSAPTARLVELSGEPCIACQLILGDQLAGRQAEQFRAALAKQQRAQTEEPGGANGVMWPTEAHS